jgi:hypothetical protein
MLRTQATTDRMSTDEGVNLMIGDEVQADLQACKNDPHRKIEDEALLLAYLQACKNSGICKLKLKTARRHVASLRCLAAWLRQNRRASLSDIAYRTVDAKHDPDVTAFVKASKTAAAPLDRILAAVNSLRTGIVNIKPSIELHDDDAAVIDAYLDTCTGRAKTKEYYAHPLRHLANWLRGNNRSNLREIARREGVAKEDPDVTAFRLAKAGRSVASTIDRAVHSLRTGEVPKRTTNHPEDELLINAYLETASVQSHEHSLRALARWLRDNNRPNLSTIANRPGDAEDDVDVQAFQTANVGTTAAGRINTALNALRKSWVEGERSNPSSFQELQEAMPPQQYVAKIPRNGAQPSVDDTSHRAFEGFEPPADVGTGTRNFLFQSTDALSATFVQYGEIPEDTLHVGYTASVR